MGVGSLFAPEKVWILRSPVLYDNTSNESSDKFPQFKLLQYYNSKMLRFQIHLHNTLCWFVVFAALVSEPCASHDRFYNLESVHASTSRILEGGITASPSQSPNGIETLSPTSSTKPSQSPSTSPSKSPIPPLYHSPIPSTVPSYKPSPSPTFGCNIVASHDQLMVLTGVDEDDFEGSRAQDHWRQMTSEYVKKYWDIERAKLNSTFILSEVATYIRKTDTGLKRKLRHNKTDLVIQVHQSSRRRVESSLRIIYWFEFTVRGSNDNSVPDEVLLIPFGQDYMDDLKEDDPTSESIFRNVQTVENGIFVEAATSSPTRAPSVETAVPTSSPTFQLYNDASKKMGIVSIALISGTALLGCFTLVAIFKSRRAKVSYWSFDRARSQII